MRGKQLTISGPSVVKFHDDVPGDAVGAVLLEHRYASALKIEGTGHSWEHYRNNTGVRLSGLWKCDEDGIHTLGRRPPQAPQVDRVDHVQHRSGSTTLTSGGAIFDSSDIGDFIILNYEKFVISAVASDTSATVAKASTQTIAGERGSFGAVRCTTVAASAMVTLESAVASASDVGRVVYILNGVAAGGAGSPKRMHRATITAVPTSNSIVLDVAVPLAVTNSEIVFSPAVDVFYDEGAFDGQPNDNVWTGLHLEQFVGTGLVWSGGVNVWLPNLKMHAQNGTYNEAASDYLAIFDNVSAVTDGQFEGTSHGRLGRIVVTGLFGLLKIGQVLGAGVRNQALVHAHNMTAAGMVTIGDWYIANPVDAATLAGAFTRTGASRIIQHGRMSSYQSTFRTIPPQPAGKGRRPACCRSARSWSLPGRHPMPT